MKSESASETERQETGERNQYMKATVIDAKDNVAVVLGEVKKGDTITWVKAGKTYEITAPCDIPVYHKIANELIRKGEPVVKYGEHIGIASCDIKAGEHVHVHNVESHRENLEGKE